MRWGESWSCNKNDLASCDRYVSADFGYQIYQKKDNDVFEWGAYISKAENKFHTGLWYNGEVRGWSTWQLHNTQFKFGEVDERANTDETDEIDDQDGEIIIDDSGDDSTTNTTIIINIDDDGSNNSTNNTDGIIIDWSNTTSDYFYEKIYEDN